MDTITKTDMIVIAIFIAAMISVVLMFAAILLVDVFKKKGRGYKTMTNEEREALKAKMAARQQDISCITRRLVRIAVQ